MFMKGLKKTVQHSLTHAQHTDTYTLVHYCT